MRYKHKVYLARAFRKQPTKSEKLVWQKIKNRQFLNLKFRRQYIVLDYIIDFYCPELKLAIEIDGGIHDTYIQTKKDKLRQQLIEKRKIKFLRFENKEIELDINNILKTIKQTINNITPPSPKLGEGGRGDEEEKIC